eukprot:scaffold279_cov246-Chaetoceros_neogracile.AAC.2
MLSRCKPRTLFKSAHAYRAFSSLLRSPITKDYAELVRRAPASIVVDDSKDLEKYNSDWTGQYKGNSRIVCRPQSTEEVASILEYCSREKIGIVPQAGNTGVVGGSIPINDEVILSVERLNEIHSFDDINGIIQCGAGCVLQTLQAKVANWNHLVPIDLGSKGTCMIGGNVATNAGGQYYYRFGSIHANIIGLEVVLPNGTILDLMSTNRKDNTGYDLKHLFVGAEGTLGVITKVALNCPRLPSARNVAFLACNSFESVCQTLSLAKEKLGEVLAAFEFMDKQVLDQVASEKTIPLTDGKKNHNFCILVETLGSDREHDMEKLESFLEQATDAGHVVDGILAQDTRQVSIWEIRESCNPIIKSKGYNYKYDISLPLSEYYSIVEEMRERLLPFKGDIVVANWGHVIDGNLHLNVITPGKFEVDIQIKNSIEPFIFEYVVAKGGSISAEHGLGQCKNNYLGKYAKSKAAVAVMRSLKDSFDPNGILNPQKFLPSSNSKN